MNDGRAVEVLSRQECWLRLGLGGIGRVGVTVGALPAIFPVNYATLDNDIVFRCAPDTLLAAAASESVVAFEVDPPDCLGHTDWTVLVVGPARVVTDADELIRAAALPLASWAPRCDDVFVRIEGRLVSGTAWPPTPEAPLF
jgi:nitroimidazol reductase NimA-like FMN-containing flavoprotein (pyridoxamine 5'-phosphate oxidase superfamily)